MKTQSPRLLAGILTIIMMGEGVIFKAGDEYARICW